MDRITVGMIFESRDEPGRRVRVTNVSDAGPNPFCTCETITNPERPGRVGTSTRIRGATLRRRWVMVEETTDGSTDEEEGGADEPR